MKTFAWMLWYSYPHIIIRGIAHTTQVCYRCRLGLDTILVKIEFWRDFNIHFSMYEKTPMQLITSGLWTCPITNHEILYKSSSVKHNVNMHLDDGLFFKIEDNIFKMIINYVFLVENFTIHKLSAHFPP